MPQLDPERYALFKQAMEGLEPELKKLNDTPRKFVEDQLQRHEQYGERMFVSDKQFNWMKQLHEEHVGPLDTASAQAASPRRDLLGDDGDMDDEIPF